MPGHFKFLFFLTLLSAVFIFAPGVLAEGNPCEGVVCGSPPPPFREYTCGSACDGQIMTRQQNAFCRKAGACGCCAWWDYIPTSWVTTGATGHPWQACSPQGVLRSPPTFSCSGSCLKTPEAPRYYDNPNYTDQPEQNKGSDNVNLPLKLDWDNVEGWEQEDGPRSYRISIPNTSQGNFSQPLTESEFIMPEACFLKSATSYNWQTQACCTANGQNCGPASNWNFTTSLAPELLSPADPDWQGQEKAVEVKPPYAENSPPATLDWCDVKDIQSWLLRVNIIENGQEICHPWLTSGQGCGYSVIKKELRPPPYPSQENLYSEFKDEKGLFTKDTTYQWEIASCLRNDGTDCSDFGEKWRFQTDQTRLQETSPLSPPDDPTGNKAVSLPLTISWEDKPGINSFIYEINPDNITGAVQPSQTTLDFPKLKLNKIYSWKVKSCWDYNGQDCEDGFSGERHFKTTGAAPALASPDKNAADIIIPVKFDWQDVSGAQSYKYEVSANSNFAPLAASGLAEKEKSEISIDYPNLKMLTSYWWRVKTCADKSGNVCGDWSEIRSFKTFKLLAPANPSPTNNGQLLTSDRYLSWSQVVGAKNYQYTIDYDSGNPPEDEQNEECKGIAGAKIVLPKISLSPTLSSLECLGSYHWQIRSCLDQNCQETGDWSTSFAFSYLQPTPSDQIGIVPCGRLSDNLKTPYNERKPCRPEHIFILFKNILDFFLWKLAPVALIALAVFTAIIYYFSMGAPASVINVRAIWKSGGIGFGIIFFAWIIIDLILSLLGFQIEIFGKWWQPPF